MRGLASKCVQVCVNHHRNNIPDNCLSSVLQLSQLIHSASKFLSIEQSSVELNGYLYLFKEAHDNWLLNMQIHQAKAYDI